jgi:hypothetical protein
LAFIVIRRRQTRARKISPSQPKRSRDRTNGPQ